MLDAHSNPGEVHQSSVPIELAFAVTLCLGALLVLPLAILGLPLLVHAIFRWVREDIDMWEDRPLPVKGEWGDSRWAMVWIIATEVIVFASFFAFWFWAKWHTISWDGTAGGTWPAEGVVHDLGLVSLNTIILLSSGVLAEQAIRRLAHGEIEAAKLRIGLTVLFGLTFLTIQLYEYSHAGFFWGDHAYGTAFFSLTGLHGLHVLVGVIAFIVVWFLIRSGHYTPERHESLHAIGWYWHFVDAVWILLYLIVYLEVI